MTISNDDDMIDSRDVIKRIEELRDELAEPVNTITDESVADAADLGDELRALKRLADARGCAPDWDHGETLIREDYFETFARALAEDIGAVNSDERWPRNCIDWEKAADELLQDYTAVDYDGVTYYTR